LVAGVDTRGVPATSEEFRARRSGRAGDRPGRMAGATVRFADRGRAD
jgi:hypothetical protein